MESEFVRSPGSAYSAAIAWSTGNTDKIVSRPFSFFCINAFHLSASNLALASPSFEYISSSMNAADTNFYRRDQSNDTCTFWVSSPFASAKSATFGSMHTTANCPPLFPTDPSCKRFTRVCIFI